MTGEISLRGLVLPVGGIEEKVLAAKRAGIQNVLLPSLNRKDLAELSAPAKEGLKFNFLETVDEKPERTGNGASSRHKRAGRLGFSPAASMIYLAPAAWMIYSVVARKHLRKRPRAKGKISRPKWRSIFSIL